MWQVTTAITRIALRTALFSTFLFCLLAVSPGHAASDQPEWCRSGYVCLSTAEAAALNFHIIDLQEEVAKLKVRRVKRWGQCSTVSVGYGLNEEFDVFLAHGFGFRW